MMKYTYMTKYLLLSLTLTVISITKINSAEIPEDLPLPIVTTVNNPSTGGIYMSPFGEVATPEGPYRNYLMILDSTGQIVKYNLLPEQEKGYKGYHFKSELNGNLSFMTRKESQELDGTVYRTDTSFNILNKFKDTVNPYKRVRYYAAHHLLANGNTLLLKYDFKYVDMTKYFLAGEPNGATLQGLLQEIDKDNNVVFQWQSLDYIPVSDTYNPVAPAIEYFHPNSLAYHRDGNILVSARNLCAIIKIDRNTGEIIWTLGGKSNDFTFIGENEANAPNYFSYQHDIRVLPNGHITIFDNGKQHSPNYSRAVEYELDEVNLTCKLVWEHRNTPDIYADIFGNFQRLPNGNSFIGWGNSAVGGGVALQELHPDGSIALELKLPEKLVSQFIYKSPWPVCPLIGKVTKDEMLELNTYEFNQPSNRTGIAITWNTLVAFIYNSLTIEKYNCAPLNPEFEGKPPIVLPFRFVLKAKDISDVNGTLKVNLNDYGIVYQPELTKIYFRASENTGLFIPLETNYDSENQQLISEINMPGGEYILGRPDIAVIPKEPILIKPENNSMPNLNQPLVFNWNPKGYFTESQLQISNNAEFTDLEIDSVLNIISYKINVPELNAKKFWRVRCGNDAGWGEWSETRTYTAADPYLKIKVPNGGEIWDTLSYVIRWDYNVLDSINSIFKVELYRNGEFQRVLRDNLFSVAYAFMWKVPSDIEEDSTYQIKVTSISNNTVNSMSSEFFTIRNKPTSVNEKYDNNSGLTISNYPNPAGKSTTFEFSSESNGQAEISICDLTGKSEYIIYSDYIDAGNHKFNWTNEILPDGAYIYKLSINNKSITGKLMIIR